MKASGNEKYIFKFSLHFLWENIWEYVHIGSEKFVRNAIPYICDVVVVPPKQGCHIYGFPRIFTDCI